MACSCSRRDFLARGLYGIGVGAGLPLFLSRTSAALTAQALQGTSVEKHPERILVVLELSGGNDGLNTVVPFGDPAYYRARPNLGIPDRTVIKVGDGFGFHPSMVGFERLYKDGLMAVVHGCGYEHPSLSHFSSMSFWHTGVPNGGEPLGWLGRLADDTYDPATHNVIVNIGNSQSLAVRSGKHSPLVFDDPARFRREGTDAEKRRSWRSVRRGRRPIPRSNSWRRRPPTRSAARTSSGRRQRRTGRRWTTASATRSAAACSVSPR